MINSHTIETENSSTRLKGSMLKCLIIRASQAILYSVVQELLMETTNQEEMI
jgi:hypothetical protein